MQWRSIVVGLLLLRLVFNFVIWLAFGLGPSWGFNFPINFNFNLHKIELFKEKERDDSRTNSWLNQLRDDIDGYHRTCSKDNEHSHKKSYLSFFQNGKDEYAKKYSSFPDKLKAEMRGMAKEMFYFGYDNYMKYAFPDDELNPIDCQGRGPDVLNPYVAFSCLS